MGQEERRNVGQGSEGSDAPEAGQGAESAGTAEEADGGAAAPPGQDPVAGNEPVRREASSPVSDGDALAMDLADLERAPPRSETEPIELLADVNLNVTIELGRTRMLVEDVLRLSEGAVVELEKLAGDPVDVYVNGRLVARGEVLVLNDNFCVRVSEVLHTGAPEDAHARSA